MQYIDRIHEIENRAGALNLSLGKVCQRAGVPASTLWRWRNGTVSPFVRTIEGHLSKLDDVLRQEEAKLRRLAS